MVSPEYSEGRRHVVDAVLELARRDRVVVAEREDPRGQVLALFVIAVAAAEAAVGLGLVIALNRNKPGADVADLNKLKW